MSTTADSHIPIRVRRRIHDNNARRTGADQQILELTGYRLARLEAEVLAPARKTAPADLRLRRIISSYVMLAITDPGIMPLLSGKRRRPDARSPATHEGFDRFVNLLQDDLAEVIRVQDRSPAIDPAVAVQSLLGIIHWGVSSHRAEGRLSRDEAAAQITFLALHGLASAPRPGPSARPPFWPGDRLRRLRRVC